MNSQTKSSFTYWSLFPLILAFYPPIALFSVNLGQVGIEKIFHPLIFSIFLTLVLFLLLLLVTKDFNKSAIVTGVFQIGFFSYGHVYDLLEGISIWGWVVGRHRYLFAFWALWMIALIVFVWGKNVSKNILRLIFITSLIATLLPVSQILFNLVESKFTTDTNSPEFSQQANIDLKAGYKPDVYYIILDTYSRSDILKKKFNYDNSDFINFLKDTGFYVVNCAKSNFNQTNLSVYLSLNMNYLEKPSEWKTFSYGRGIRENAARKQFESLGYKTVAFETGYNFTEWFDADYYFLPTSTALGTKSILSNLNSFDTMFLRSTMFAPYVEANIQQANYAEESYRRSVTLFTLEKLKEVPQITGPKLVFVHLSINHPPFVFDAAGGLNPDLIKVTRPVVENDEYNKGYVGTLGFTDRVMQDVITAILQNSPTPPVIIVQGDHGPATVSSSKYFEILDALYLPGVDHSDLYPTLSPINSFRIVFNKYFGLNYELLPDESYSSNPSGSAVMIPNTCPAE